MNEKQFIRSLAAAARDDAPPAVDVSAVVMSRICAQPKRRRANVLMWSYAAASAVAATFVAVWATHLMLLRETAAMDLLGPAMRALP